MKRGALVFELLCGVGLWLCGAGLWAMAAGGGCASSQADGEACSEDDDCRSGYCQDGYCAGSECSCEGCSESEAGRSDGCEEGWLCGYIPPSALDEIGADIGDFFGTDDGEAEGSYRCRATCGNCPPSYHCEGGELCVYGKPEPVVEVSLFDDPAAHQPEVARGQMVAFEAQASIEQGNIVRFRWSIRQSGDDGALGDEETVEETTAGRLEHTFEASGNAYVTVEAFADNGTSASAHIDVNVCGVAGDGCLYGYTFHCCRALSCSMGNTCG